MIYVDYCLWKYTHLFVTEFKFSNRILIAIFVLIIHNSVR